MVSGAAGAAGSAYNEIMALELEGAGPGGPGAQLRGDGAASHELRTRIETTSDGQGRQVIDPAGGFRLRVVLTSRPEAGRRARRAAGAGRGAAALRPGP